jgi:hypothetical protein
MAIEAREDRVQIDVATPDRRHCALGHIYPEARGIAEAGNDVKFVTARVGEDDRVISIKAQTKRGFLDRQRVENAARGSLLDQILQRVNGEVEEEGREGSP